MAYTTEWEMVTIGMIILCPDMPRTETVLSISTVGTHPNEVLVTTDHDQHYRMGSEYVDYRPAHYILHEL